MDGPGTPFDRRTMQPTFPPLPLSYAESIRTVEDDPLPPGAALIIVKMPAEAELWFDDAKTEQGGSYRRFLTPPLPNGQDLQYTVRVHWQIWGVELTRTEKVEVAAGGRFTLNFLTVDSWTGRRLETLPTPRMEKRSVSP
jgi:uncharacterized protein (TIGR03000 family)